jgi:hypothetical protein
MTTQISTLQIWYQGVSISNAYAGPRSPNPVNGVIFHPDGIVIELTGGYNHPAVTASVFNSTHGTTPVGVVCRFSRGSRDFFRCSIDAVVLGPRRR